MKLEKLEIESDNYKVYLQGSMIQRFHFQRLKLLPYISYSFIIHIVIYFDIGIRKCVVVIFIMFWLLSCFRNFMIWVYLFYGFIKTAYHLER